VNALEDKKAENIVLIDIHEVAIFTDYFIICSGTSTRMLDSLASTALEAGGEKRSSDGRKQGPASSGWVAVDLDDVVVHVFTPEQRKYYQLEKLWENGKVLLTVQ
jgi:ribosome-associated protein